MTTLTVTPEPQYASVDVLVEGIDPSVSEVVILRTGIDGAPVPLRGSPFSPSGGIVAAVDGEAPLGVQIRYTVVEDGTSTETVLATLDVDRPWLTHPLAPFLSTEVVVRDDTDWTYAPRLFTFDVIGRTEPVTVWYPRSSRSGRLVIEYATVQQRTDIETALRTGAPMLLRFPPGYEQFRSSYVGVGEARVIPNGVGSRHGVIECDYTVVAAPPSSVSVPLGNWTWDDVPSEFASWDALVAGLPSWLAVIFHNPVAPSPAPPWSPPLPGPPPVFGA